MKKVSDFLEEWAWLIIGCTLMILFWGTVFYEIYQSFNSK